MQYGVLDVRRAGAFRVLRILPDFNDRVIQLTLSHANFRDERYFCLSYTWKPQHPTHVILVNGEAISIGDNLWQFLHSARAGGLETALWVDALCIDQCNLEERSHQVSCMGEIYKHAEQVLLWFGLLKRSQHVWFKSMKALEKTIVP